jgi:hypothetical protein
MARFLVLPREPSDAWDDVSPADMQRIIERYVAWGNELAEAGMLEGGEKLQDGDGRVLGGEGAALRVTNGPFAEAKEVVGGFWIVRAHDYEEAVRLVSDCPHLAFGSLEVRRIEETSAEA